MNEKKLPLAVRISRALEISDDTLGGLSCMCIYDNHTLIVDCCEGVNSYTENSITFQLKGMLATVSGNHLQLSTFRFGRITVNGQITGLEIRKTPGDHS